MSSELYLHSSSRPEEVLRGNWSMAVPQMIRLSEGSQQEQSMARAHSHSDLSPACLCSRCLQAASEGIKSFLW